VSTGQTLAERGVEALANIPVFGYINDIAIGPKARFCVVAVGQEPKLGRWNRIPKAKNRFGIIRLRTPHDGEDNDYEEEEPSQPKSTTISNHANAKHADVEDSPDDDMSAES
jgi:hypothetical protein